MNPKLVKAFKADLKEHGVTVALYNYTAVIAKELLSGVGVKRMQLTPRKKAAARSGRARPTAPSARGSRASSRPSKRAVKR